jgi:hypothetical protein
VIIVDWLHTSTTGRYRHPVERQWGSTPQWLKDGDVVDAKAKGAGVLSVLTVRQA